ncbi:unnamed protein product [Triticum turgidum subsp. durum]|uniref:Uncharacterized protein n=1 Tax=Triticum turgidum subsp. durum TaxID=4567 RepID=A0A9R0SSW5_TRITD|nr:unnamed protein product [Triticum turgidum subsp. durum]
MIELTVVATVAAKVAPKLTGFFLRRRWLLAELEHDIEHIQRECSIIAAAITDDGNHQHASDAAEAHQEWIKIVRDLAYDIDDCIDRFIHRISTAPVADAGWIRQKAHWLKTVRARGKFTAAIVRLRKRSDEASELRKKYTDLAYGHGRATAVFDSWAHEVKPEPEMYTDNPVGTDAAEEELMELIRGSSTQGHQPKEKLKVISVVGFGGIGKSQLAKRVYDRLDDESQYPARAWVRAAEKGPEDLLQAILQELGAHTTTISASSSNTKLCATIQKRLGTQRFLIVIDDMREDFWVDIKDAFPVVPGVDSRVLVTTARQTIAIKSSSSDGHVYVMRTLADDHSRQLFCEEASLVYPPSVGDTKLSSEVIKRCDGLPLALVTTARLLHGESRPEQWADLGGNLGEHLENNKKLASMNGVLVRSYTGLSKQHIKTCLLYLGIYPSGRPIRRGSLIRRWSAEGFITAEHKRSAREVAFANFNELVDSSIIHPIDVSSSSRAEVKACQTHGIMLEFLLHKSMCENFVTLLYDDVPPPSKVRWLSLHSGSAASSRINPNDVPFLRSLTIFGKAHKSVFNFSKYKLMRVLDLEECHELMEDKHLKGICSNLVLLRYLSLRGASKITVLPKEVKKLQLLETLDVRGTNIDILPTQVMQLQSLLHLFGKFKLPQGIGGRKMRKLQAWLQEEENSKLQTVAGFVVDGKSQGFAQLMGEMKKLTKVKIWCESTTDASNYLSHLSEAIKEFIERGTDPNKARSLSLNMNGAWSQGFLNFSLESDPSCYVSSLKLQGNNISSLPPFVTMLGGLTKLCLSFSHLQLSSGILEALNSISGLKYLKLNATRMDNLVIEEDALGSLKRLCIVVEVITGLVIEEGALPDLESLQLLCKDLNGFSSTRIQCLPRLKEVTLHDGVSEGTKKEWKGAIKNHSRHPKLLFVTKQMVDDHFKPMRTEAAPEISPEETAVDAMVVESEPVENSESSGAPHTDTALLVPTQPTVQVVTSEMVDAQDLMGTESAMETSPVAISTNTTENIDVESEHALNSESLVAPPTDMMLPMTTPSDVISTEQSVQLSGGCQHNDDGKDLDNIEDPKDFATENGLSKESYKVNMEGVACLEDLDMKDGTQKQGLKTKQRLRARLLSLVKIGVFRHTRRQGRLVHRLD